MDLISKILKNKINYFIILIFIIFYMRQENRILSFPNYLNYVIFGISFLVLFFLNKKYSTKNKKNNFLYHIFNISILIIFGIFLTAIIKIPLNYTILKSTFGNEIEEVCKINNFISGRMEKIYFIFDGEKQSTAFKNENHLTRNNIVNNYMLKINYRNSILGTKVIENYELTKK